MCSYITEAAGGFVGRGATLNTLVKCGLLRWTVLVFFIIILIITQLNDARQIPVGAPQFAYHSMLPPSPTALWSISHKMPSEAQDGFLKKSCNNCENSPKKAAWGEAAPKGQTQTRGHWKHQQQHNRSMVQQHHHGCVEITAGGHQCCRDDHQLWPPLHGQCIYIQRCRRKLQCLFRDKHPPALFPVPMGMGSKWKTLQTGENHQLWRLSQHHSFQPLSCWWQRREKTPDT